MGAMKRLYEEIREAMGDAYDLMLAEEHQASLIAANLNKVETTPNVHDPATDRESHLAIATSEK